MLVGTSKPPTCPSISARSRLTLIACPLARHHYGRQLLAQPLVGDPEGHGFGDTFALVERVLNLKAADVLAAPDHDVLDAINEVDEFLLVGIGQVPGSEPAVLKRPRRRVGLVPVASHHGRAAHPQFAGIARIHLLAVLGTNDLHVHQDRQAAATGRHSNIVGRADLRAYGVGLGHAPARARLGVLQHFRDCQHVLGRSVRSATAHGKQGRQCPPLGLGGADQVARYRRHRDEVRDPIPVDDLDGFVGVPLVHQGQPAAKPKGGQHADVTSSDVEERNRDEHAELNVKRFPGYRIAPQYRLGAVLDLPSDERVNDIAVRRNRRLGPAGRPRCVKH